MKTFGILEKWSLMRGGRLREVVAKGGSTVFCDIFQISFQIFCETETERISDRGLAVERSETKICIKRGHPD